MDASAEKNGASSPLPVVNSPNRLHLHSVNSPMPRPKLLPAFEPFSSSPPARSSKKRAYPEDTNGFQHYPTPVPTSSTGILPSSPRPSRPTLQRTASAMSERSPLSDVPTVPIPEDGTQLLLGRSSGSCHFQLPYNRLISRIHVGVTYLAPTREYASGRVVIECLGWNGCKILCQGRVEEVFKENPLTLSNPTAEIILDVLDTRVILAWPEVEPASFLPANASWLNASPKRRIGLADPFASSPPPIGAVSPFQAQIGPQVSLISPPSESAWKTSVEVYEDPASDDKPASPLDQVKAASFAAKSFESNHTEYSENENEENEPMVHSFGPFGDNILNRLHSFSATSPEQQRPPIKRRRTLGPDSLQSSPLSSPLRQLSESPHEPASMIHPTEELQATVIKKHPNESPIKNHVINQLAFSRVHSTPISSIFKALPANLKSAQVPDDAPADVEGELTADMLRSMLDATPCIGEIAREGKDAAGKQLENEFYYLPDADENVARRETVVNGMGNTGLRAVRKNHKQYFWKRPRH